MYIISFIFVVLFLVLYHVSDFVPYIPGCSVFGIWVRHQKWFTFWDRRGCACIYMINKKSI